MNIDEYERQGREIYAALSAAVAAILVAAIGAEHEYRLQQVTDRAKQPASLRKKLKDRDIGASDEIETEIKDLAGCRVIFYTNGDVARFINSGLIQENFEVLDVKLHHPQPTSDDAVELYISNHYIVRLRSERITLPEYARFAGMRCEIQIQTILNHAWAEMAHDTIYKEPALGNFGGKALDAIKGRMAKVARKYLVPAGYEFQKIANDFQRLVQGKELFDGDALAAIVAAPDNNVRAEALESFVEGVLPLYDDPQEIYPEVVEQLLFAADRARQVSPVTIETPYGTLPAKTYTDIAKAISEVLRHYRYLDVDLTFSALCKLHSWAESDRDREVLIELGNSLAKHEIEVWRLHRPIVQATLVERIGAMSESECIQHAPILVAMLGSILGTEVSATSSSSSTMTFHRGAVVVSDRLRAVRAAAIDLLLRQFHVAIDDAQRRAVLYEFQNATRLPFGTTYGSALAQMVAVDTRTIVDFLAGVTNDLSLHMRQDAEEWISRCYWNAGPPVTQDVDAALLDALAGVRASALAFREAVNSDMDFVIYKVLVGFNSVYPPAWEDNEFQLEQMDAYRKGQIDVLLKSVNESNADLWFDRINRYSKTESDDAATFPVFGKFLTELAETRPAIVHKFIDRMELPLSNFLPAMLDGLMRSSEKVQTEARVHAWIDAGEHLRHIAWYLRFAVPFDETLLVKTFEGASQRGDLHSVRNTLLAAASQFQQHPGALIEKVFLPALRQLMAAADSTWARMPWASWHKSPIIRALDEIQAQVVLDCLVRPLRLESSLEQIVATIADQWPAIVVEYLGRRQELARLDEKPLGYDALPFAVHQLKKPLAANPDLLLEGARSWYQSYPGYFTYDGGQLLASVFPELPDVLFQRLEKLIAGGAESDLKFVLAVLSAFEGIPRVFDLVRLVVAALDSGSEVLSQAGGAIQPTGVVRGAFGFAEAFSARRELLRGWLDDPSDRVRAFATDCIAEFDRRIAAENRSAEASIALRKLNYGEELDDDDSASS